MNLIVKVEAKDKDFKATPCVLEDPRGQGLVLRTYLCLWDNSLPSPWPQGSSGTDAVALALTIKSLMSTLILAFSFAFSHFFCMLRSFVNNDLGNYGSEKVQRYRCLVWTYFWCVLEDKSLASRTLRSGIGPWPWSLWPCPRQSSPWPWPWQSSPW